MAAQELTRFQLNLHGIALELEGERDFVDEMYREIMRDIEEARARFLAGKPSGLEIKIPPKSGKKKGLRAPPVPPLPSLGEEPTELIEKEHRPAEHVIWLHRCSSLVHKIYMTHRRELNGVAPFHRINTVFIKTAYIEDDLLSSLLPRYDKGQTLWAELTRAGREKIAEASKVEDSDKTSVYKPLKSSVKGTSST